ncbi:hypothetical protein RUM43_003744 [Polyplax serrata]|uniref:Uncharacterized protein n=1 Tax=Polyplax serrata TaxID=468196 RepID=A0AAN8PFD9_POLSC
MGEWMGENVVNREIMALEQSFCLVRHEQMRAIMTSRNTKLDYFIQQLIRMAWRDVPSRGYAECKETVSVEDGDNVIICQTSKRHGNRRNETIIRGDTLRRLIISGYL